MGGGGTYGGAADGDGPYPPAAERAARPARPAGRKSIRSEYPRQHSYSYDPRLRGDDGGGPADRRDEDDDGEGDWGGSSDGVSGTRYSVREASDASTTVGDSTTVATRSSGYYRATPSSSYSSGGGGAYSGAGSPAISCPPPGRSRDHNSRATGSTPRAGNLTAPPRPAPVSTDLYRRTDDGGRGTRTTGGIAMGDAGGATGRSTSRLCSTSRLWGRKGTAATAAAEEEGTGPGEPEPPVPL
ncbi:hypothetical protein THAOC_02032, partial [Thalassiosira oceanica]